MTTHHLAAASGTQQELLARLKEAEDTLKALRSGEVDALVVNGPEGEQVFTLQGADFVYQVIVEQMGEGAASLALDGSILYCNRRLAEMLRLPLERTIGGSLRRFLKPSEQARLTGLIQDTLRNDSARSEFTLNPEVGRPIPVVISFSNLSRHGVPAVSAIVTDLTAEKERADHLALANQELEAFNYSASHDLRSPLRAIAGYSQSLASESERLDERGREYCGRIVKAAHRMSTIIDAMLNLSRTTLAEFNLTNVDLSALAREIADELQNAEPQRKVSVRITPGLQTHGDRDLLKQALQNLLENAWKFTGPVKHARIEFGETRREGRSVFFIRDNGVGFDEAFSEKLFQPFQSLHARRSFPGAGSGLAVVARIIRRHRGSIWAQSRPGKGATFYFTLPAPEAAQR